MLIIASMCISGTKFTNKKISVSEKQNCIIIFAELYDKF